MKHIQSKALKISNWIGSVPSLIVHSVFFTLTLLSPIIFNIDFEKALLVLTTVVSLEAIYLSIFIQMAVNQNTQALITVEKDIDEIQKDVEEISEDVGEISDDIEEITDDVENIEKDIDEIQKDVEEISDDIEEITDDVENIEKDIDEIQKDVEEISDDIEEINEEEVKK